MKSQHFRTVISNTKASCGTGSKFSLASVRKDVLAHCANLQDRSLNAGAFRASPDGHCDLYSSCDVAIMLAVMGENLERRLTAPEREQWVAHINSFAEEDGTYGDRMGQSALHANGMVIGALGVLGGRRVQTARLYDSFSRPETVGPWLDSLDWQRAWPQSHAFWGGIHCFSMSASASSEWLSAVFDWLERNIDRRTGWWRAGTPHVDRNQGLGAAAHLFPLYEHHGRAFPEPERVIDSVLAMQLPDGTWLEERDRPAPEHAMNYLELDALYALSLMGKQTPEYRRGDVLASIRIYSEAAKAYYRRHRQQLFSLHPHYVLAAVGTFGLLQQLLPDDYVDDRAWTDIFSDKTLYRT